MYSDQLKRIEAEVARTNELLREQQRLAALSPEERAKEERRRREAEARESNDHWRIKQAEADRKRKKRDRMFAFFGALAAIILYANGLLSLGIILGIAALFAGWSVLRQFTENATRKALVRMFAFFAALAAIILAAGGQTDLAVSASLPLSQGRLSCRLNSRGSGKREASGLKSDWPAATEP
jgi:hypothetical protein